MSSQEHIKKQPGVARTSQEHIKQPPGVAKEQPGVRFEATPCRNRCIKTL